LLILLLLNLVVLLKLVTRLGHQLQNQQAVLQNASQQQPQQQQQQPQQQQQQQSDEIRSIGIFDVNNINQQTSRQQQPSNLFDSSQNDSKIWFSQR
jgi:hypothetical protein